MRVCIFRELFAATINIIHIYFTQFFIKFSSFVSFCRTREWKTSMEMWPKHTAHHIECRIYWNWFYLSFTPFSSSSQHPLLYTFLLCIFSFLFSIKKNVSVWIATTIKKNTLVARAPSVFNSLRWNFIQ